MCTDGILERRSPAGEFFTEEGLKRVVRAAFDASAEEILDRIFEEAGAFGEARPWEDDATAVVVRRSR
jgi:serine phosphatase RsbU (regulator of sigma subunit)